MRIADIDYIIAITIGQSLERRTHMAEKGSWTRSPIVGGIVGVFAGGLTILLVQSLGHRLFGTGDLTDPSSITTPMFASVLVAWILGASVAGWLGTYWARSQSTVLGTIAGLVLLAGSVSNMIAIPHPTWMMIAAVVLMPVAAIVAARRAAAPNAG